MFSANKITGMTVVLSETLKEIISDQDKFQRDHPYSVFNQKKTNAGNWKYVAVKPWENVTRGSIPKQTSRRPNAGYTGHIPALRETHSATYGTSLKLAQRATHSETIRQGDHYADGGHFVATQTVGSLAGGQVPSMPASAAATPAGSHQPTPLGSARSSQRSQGSIASRRSRGSRASQQSLSKVGDGVNGVRGDVLGDDTRSQCSFRSRGSSLRSSEQSQYSTMSQAAQAHRVKELFKELPPSRQQSLMTEMMGSIQQ